MRPIKRGQSFDRAAFVQLALHQYERHDLRLCPAARSWRRDRPRNRNSVLTDASGERGEEACASTGEPPFEPVQCPRSDHRPGSADHPAHLDGRWHSVRDRGHSQRLHLGQAVATCRQPSRQDSCRRYALSRSVLACHARLYRVAHSPIDPDRRPGCRSGGCAARRRIMGRSVSRLTGSINARSRNAPHRVVRHAGASLRPSPAIEPSNSALHCSGPSASFENLTKGLTRIAG